MDEKFKVPAQTFLTGFFLWLIYTILHGVLDAANGFSNWIDFAICVITSGLIVFSAYYCRKAGGPRVGAIVRMSVLLVLAGVTSWQMELWTAIPIIAGVVIILPLTLMKYD